MSFTGKDVLSGFGIVAIGHGILYMVSPGYCIDMLELERRLDEPNLQAVMKKSGVCMLGLGAVVLGVAQKGNMSKETEKICLATMLGMSVVSSVGSLVDDWGLHRKSTCNKTVGLLHDVGSSCLFALAAAYCLKKVL
eukprot:g64220.t1